MFKDKIVLITGGTGSFGNAVLAKLLSLGVKEIRIFSRDEKKQDDMRKLYNNPKIKFHIGDVRDFLSVKSAMKNVDYVFHAAALKQVPSCEFYPLEAVKTNVLGTENVLLASIESGVKKVVCLSTDKAAYPVNAMGISKAMMEKIIIAKALSTNPSETEICITRYGNVLYSRGSVVPLFISQIKNNSPITLTSKEMTRFIMSLEEAMNLVLFAFEHGRSGDIMIQKAPSCYIFDLASAIIDVFQSSSEIKVIGTRHGEKMYEALLTKEEAARAIDMGNYFRVPSDNRDLNYSKYLEDGNQKINITDEYNSLNTIILQKNEIINKLMEISDFEKELHDWREKNK